MTPNANRPSRRLRRTARELTATLAAIAVLSASSARAAYPIATVNPTNVYQTIEGFGGAIAFYNGWITAHPYRQEIYTNAFSGLNLSMLRLGNWFRYQAAANFDAPSFQIVSNANRVLGRPVPILMSSWSPPAFLKSNGQVGNGGTLLYSNGGFVYREFAQYWYDSLLAYRSNGVSPSWISIQNEPDWQASYDSCVFRPTEGYYNGTNWAGYSNALSATFLRLANLASPPRVLGPEPVGIGYGVPQNYAARMNSDHFYGFNYHLYHGSTDGSANGYISALRATTNLFPGQPKFMTEFGVSNMVECATLIHNCLTEGQVSGYNHWSLVWPGRDGGLIQIEFPWDQSQWTNAPPGTPTQSHGWWFSPSYWSMKHFSYYITPGSRRIAASCTDPNVKVSAYVTADNLQLLAVFINRGTITASTVDLNFASFPFVYSSVYQTAGTNKFQPLGPAGAQLTMPPQSLTTVVLDKLIVVGPATDPSPAHNATGVGYGATLSWLPGSNAVTHSVYLGLNSNAVAQATPASPEFKGNLRTTSVALPLSGGATYFWRVDEIAGANTNTGVVWSFTTALLPALAHRYSFSETGGTNVADSVGGAAWSGTLQNGGTFSGGQLTLASASLQHARLPAGIVSTLTNLTIETWVRLNSTTSWSRIFDFGSNTTTNMFLTPQNGSTSRLRFALTTSGAGGEQQINGASALTAGVWYRVIVTLSGNTGMLYLNGLAVGTNSGMTLKPYDLGSTLNNYIGRSQYSDPYFNGSIDEFRIYSVALSPSEIAATEALGPNEVLSAASPFISLTHTPSSLTLGWPVASAGFTLQSCTNPVPANWATVLSPVPRIIDGQWQVTLPVSATTLSTFYRLVK